MNNIMLDIETLGTDSSSVITSIGAVKFDNEGVDEDNAFFTNVSIQSCLDAGMTVSGETIQWWLTQEGEARKDMFTSYPYHIKDGLMSFGIWATRDSKIEDNRVWGNGSTFDNVIISNAYKAIKKHGSTISQPWTYRGDRCYRTLCSLCPEIKMERVGTYHNAKDDAVSQARHLIKIAKRLNIEL